MSKIKNIIDGWKNVIVKDEQVEKIASERQKICDGCEYKIEFAGKEVCGQCYCPLMAKTRSMNEECPLKKWSKNI